MKTRVLLIPPLGQPSITVVDLPEEPNHTAIAKLVIPLIGGGKHVYMERVRVLADFDGGTNYQPTDMIVDEDFLRKRLPRNEYATTIYRRATMLGRTGVPAPSDPETLPPILGTAVLFDRRIWF
jgi:hypothetical protein